MENLLFPQDFLWGCATASYQVEGAGEEDGRKPCIWDTFSKVPGAVYAGESGVVAVDQYHRYHEDILLMRRLGFKSYRFSIAWPRILPDGRGKVNEKGVAYYRRLCEALHEAGLTAVATLYHWDLPQSLEDEGGWTVRSTSDAFAAYAEVCFDKLGDVVDQWITLNEPYCSAYLGYLYGQHAPGRKDLDAALKAVHYLNLAHGLALRNYRDSGLSAPIGVTWNPQTPRPATGNGSDQKAAAYARAFETEVFTNPVFGLGYPTIVTHDLGLSFPVVEGDMELISQKIDFYGVNYYNEYPVSWDESSTLKYRSEPTWQETQDMNWPIVPGGLRRQLLWLNELSGGLPVYITENGCACDDKVSADHCVHDPQRIMYLAKHFSICSDLINEGLPLKGYFVWSFLDNYEWSWGYSKRFGITYVDYQTMERIPKDSAYFMRDVIAGFGEY
ncbi:MAG: GH1 family beta-glucosidase [Sphaerochaetaceae bacterium]|nr:GH1 family beta-glucosidase [Sphaerochaetaceae bacterium]